MRRAHFYVAVALFCVLLAATYCRAQSPTPFDTSKIDYSQFTPEEIAATEAHRNKLKGEVRATLSDQAVINTAHGATLDEALGAALDTKRAFDAYQLATETQITRGNKAIAALDHVLKKLHLAKFLLCGIWILVCVMLFTKLPPLLKTYGLYICGGFAVSGCALIWFYV